LVSRNDDLRHAGAQQIVKMHDADRLLLVDDNESRDLEALSKASASLANARRSVAGNGRRGDDSPERLRSESDQPL
jgi:hypothetical protein